MNSILNWLRPARAAQRARVIGPWVTSRKPNDYPDMSVQQSQEAREIAQRLAGVFHMDAQELMNQARKMVQGSGFSVLYLLKVWEKTANECPHWLGATKEGANSMNTESKPITNAAVFEAAKIIKTAAEVAVGRLKKLDPAGDVAAELVKDISAALLRAAVVEGVAAEADKEGASAINLQPGETVEKSVFSDESLRRAINDTVQALANMAPAHVSAALTKHLELLLKAEAIRASLLCVVEEQKGQS